MNVLICKHRSVVITEYLADHTIQHTSVNCYYSVEKMHLIWGAVVKHGPVFTIFGIHNRHTSESGVQMMMSLCIYFYLFNLLLLHPKCRNRNDAIYMSFTHSVCKR